MINFHAKTTFFKSLILCDKNSIDLFTWLQSERTLVYFEDLRAISGSRNENKERCPLFFAFAQFLVDNFADGVHGDIDPDNSVEKLFDKKQIGEVRGNGFPS